MKKLKFGVIGCGMMGREFAVATARWMNILEDVIQPEIVAVADTELAAMEWFIKKIPSINFSTKNYKELLERKDVDAVYCAVPHVFHEQMYIDIIKAGKHFMGEKPFGIDMQANKNILSELADHPSVFCRCCSEFPFYPSMTLMEDWIEKNKFGKILEVKTGFLHSSDMDIKKPVNWKRRIKTNGEYGCMGDLGMHIMHIPLRYGWIPKSAYAILSDIIHERPDGKGGVAPCETYDNAEVICRSQDSEKNEFPISFEMKRLSPGSINKWYIKVIGFDASAYYSTDDPGAFHYLQTNQNGQGWTRINVGFKPQFKTITGSIFEFGFSDAILQMWVSFMKEFEGKHVNFGCVLPEETRISHKIMTAALLSHKNRSEEKIDYADGSKL